MHDADTSVALESVKRSIMQPECLPDCLMSELVALCIAEVKPFTKQELLEPQNHANSPTAWLGSPE